MSLRILNLMIYVLALLVVDGCAKRESKQIGAGGKVTKGTPDSGTDGETSNPGGSADDDGASKAGESEGEDGEDDTLPEGLSKSEYEQGKKYIGAWTGLEDEPDPEGKWTLKKMPNPESLAGSLGSSGSSSGGATLAEVMPILQQACVSCHNPSGSRSSSPMATEAQALQQYEGIKAKVRNGSMPPAGPLPAAQADIIARWTKDVSANSAAPAGAAPNQQQQQQQLPQQQQQQQPSGNGNGGGSGFGGL